MSEGERDGTVEVYLLTRNASPGGHRERPDSVQLDPIPKEVVGAARIKAILVAAERAGWDWAQRGLRLVLGLTKPVSAPELTTPPRVSVSPAMRIQIPNLELVGLLTSVKKGMKMITPCGLFEVIKTNMMYRVIFDARPANVRLQRSAGPLPLFRIEELCAATAAWIRVREAGGGDIQAAALDFRHFFYQIPIHPSLAAYFTINTKRGTHIPRVMPMGWHDAPTIAQCISMMVALYDRKQPKQDIPELPSAISRADFDIFVLLDGIYIVGKADAVERERRRMDANIQDWGIRVKGAGWSTCTFNADEQIEFSGVIMRADGCKPAATFTPKRPTTAAQWASCLGSLLWGLRVRQAGRSGGALLGHEPLLELWGRVSTELRANKHMAYQGANEDWLMVTRIGEFAFAPTFTPWSLERRAIPTRVRVVDASTEAWCWVEFAVNPDLTVGAVVQTRWEPHNVASQVEAEANGARHAAANHVADTVLLGLDADSIRFAIDKGYSKSAYLREMLRSLLGRPWPWTFRVPSEENIADLDTREATRGEWCAAREDASRRRAQAALDGIRHLLRDGPPVGGIRRKESPARSGERATEGETETDR